jgi:hypothetical protein
MEHKSISLYVFVVDIVLAICAAFLWGAVGSLFGTACCIVGAVIGFVSAIFFLLLFQGRSQT